MKFKVSVFSKNESESEAKTYQFPPQKVKVGRLKDNDIVLNFPAVSGYHGKMRFEYNGKPQAFVTDFGSLNGIIIDGERIEPNKEVPVDFDKLIDLCIFRLKVEPLPSPEEEKDIREEEYSQEAATMPLTGIISRFRNRQPEEKKTEAKPQSEEKAAESEVRVKKAAEAKAAAEEKARKEEQEKEKEKAKEKEQEVKGKDEEAGRQSKKPKGEPPGEVPAKRPTQEASVTLKAGENLEDLDFFAEEIFSLSGVVLSRGKPVEGVTVSGGDLGELKTDDKGGFFFEEVVEGSDYKIVFAKSGFKFEPRALSGQAEEDHSVTISATRMIELNGRILHKGKPLSGVEVDGGPLGGAKSEADGYFNFPSTAEGTEYEFVFSLPEFRFEPAKVQGKAGDNQPIAIAATKLVTVKGRVVHKGKPLEGVEIDAGPLGKTTTDADGVYVFKDVAEDTEFTIKARKPKYHLAANKK